MDTAQFVPVRLLDAVVGLVVAGGWIHPICRAEEHIAKIRRNKQTRGHYISTPDWESISYSDKKNEKAILRTSERGGFFENFFGMESWVN